MAFPNWELIPQTKQNWKAKLWFDQQSDVSIPSRLEDLSHLFKQQIDGSSETYKHDKTTTVTQISYNAQAYILKRYNARSRWHKIKRALRVSRAERCWRMAQKFNQAGLRTAKPILALEDRFGPFRKTAFFLSEFLEGKELLSQLPKMEKKEQLLVKAAINESFSLMKQYRITHGDLKASNLLWVNQSIYFIDLDAARTHKNDSSWQRFHNKDRKRFLKNWKDHPQLLSLFSDLDH